MQQYYIYYNGTYQNPQFKIMTSAKKSIARSIDMSLAQSNANLPQFNSQIGQHLNNLATVFSVLDRNQNHLQAIREALTIRQDFNPQTLFKYLVGNDKELTRKHILNVMEDNQEYVHEEELKIIFSLNGSKQKDKMTYVTFLNFIYPYNIETLKQISTVNIKKYAKNINDPINEQILCLFLMIIKGEIQLLKEFEVNKCDLFPRISRDKIKKLIIGIKKSNDSAKQNSQFKSDNMVTFQEMKYFLKKMKKTPENRVNSVCRRLSMGKEEGFINLQQLEFWLKSWNKLKDEDGSFYAKENRQKTLFEELSCQIQQVQV